MNVLVMSLGNHLQTYVFFFFRTSWDIDFMHTRHPQPSVMANEFSVLWLVIDRLPSDFLKLFK